MSLKQDLITHNQKLRGSILYWLIFFIFRLVVNTYNFFSDYLPYYQTEFNEIILKTNVDFRYKIKLFLLNAEILAYILSIALIILAIFFILTKNKSIRTTVILFMLSLYFLIQIPLVYPKVFMFFPENNLPEFAPTIFDYLQIIIRSSSWMIISTFIIIYWYKSKRVKLYLNEFALKEDESLCV